MDAISHEEIVNRLREFAFGIAEALGTMENGTVNAWVSTGDIETLNLAISALGGKPVRLETDERPGEDPVDMVPF